MKLVNAVRLLGNFDGEEGLTCNAWAWRGSLSLHSSISKLNKKFCSALFALVCGRKIVCLHSTML